MTKKELFEKVAQFKAENQEVMQTMYDALDDEHKEKFDKNERMKKTFDKHGVNHKGKDKDKDKDKK